MSRLGDLLVEHGPFKPGDIPPGMIRRPTASDYNALRDELVGLRAARDELGRRIKVQEQQDRCSWDYDCELTAECPGCGRAGS